MISTPQAESLNSGAHAILCFSLQMGETTGGPSHTQLLFGFFCMCFPYPCCPSLTVLAALNQPLKHNIMTGLDITVTSLWTLEGCFIIYVRLLQSWDMKVSLSDFEVRPKDSHINTLKFHLVFTMRFLLYKVVTKMRDNWLGSLAWDAQGPAGSGGHCDFYL